MTRPYFVMLCGLLTGNASAQPGTLDGTFTDQVSANSTVARILVQPDGGIIVGGWFESFNGVPIRGLVRIDQEGNIDPTFTTPDNVAMPTVAIVEAVFDANGRIITTTSTGGNGIRRFLPDGGLDPSFAANPNVDPPPQSNFMVIAYQAEVQPDGKILMTCNGNGIDGVPIVNGIVRLNEDGSVDGSFLAEIEVKAFALRSSGGIYATTVSAPGIMALDAFGAVEDVLDPGAGFALVGSTPVRLERLSDGDLLAFGAFTAYDGQDCPGLVRLNADAGRDTGFQADNVLTDTSHISSVVEQADGKILVAYNHQNSSGGVVRLNADGSLDASFTTLPITGGVGTMALESDGDILIGGNFTAIDSIPCARIARLNAGTTPGFNEHDGTRATLVAQPSIAASGQRIRLAPGRTITGPVEVSLSDATGSVVMSVRTVCDPMNGSAFILPRIPDGLYLIRLSHADGSAIGRVVVSSIGPY